MPITKKNRKVKKKKSTSSHKDSHVEGFKNGPQHSNLNDHSHVSRSDAFLTLSPKAQDTKVDLESMNQTAEKVSPSTIAYQRPSNPSKQVQGFQPFLTGRQKPLSWLYQQDNKLHSLNFKRSAQITTPKLKKLQI